MAAITYRSDIAPHLKLGLIYRRLRMQRWQTLQRQAPYPDYDPFAWAESARTSELLAGIAVLAWLIIADSGIFNRFRPGRLARPGLM